MSIDFSNYKIPSKEETVKPVIQNIFVDGDENDSEIKDTITVKPLPEALIEKQIVPVVNQSFPELKEPKAENRIFDSLRKKETIVVTEKTPLGVEYEDHPNKRFMKDLPRYELKHKDHSGLIIAKQCLLKYFFKEILCMHVAEDTNIYFPWGSAYHIFRQRLSELYGFGENTPTRYDDTLARTAFKKASEEGIAYWMKNGQDQEPGSRYDWFTTERLYKSFTKSFEHWVIERKMGRYKILAVEQFFVVQLKDGRFVQGRIDELVEETIGGLKDLWGRDYKTTSKDENWFLKGMIPNNQIKTYTFGNGKLSGVLTKGIIIQAMYNAKSTKAGDKGPEIYEHKIECLKSEIDTWEDEQVHWNRILQSCREHDIWPASENACAYCEYQIVCIKPTEAAKQYTLENKFVRRLRNPATVNDSE